MRGILSGFCKSLFLSLELRQVLQKLSTNYGDVGSGVNDPKHVYPLYLDVHTPAVAARIESVAAWTVLVAALSFQPSPLSLLEILQYLLNVLFPHNCSTATSPCYCSAQ